MTKGRTCLIPKNEKKEIETSHFRPIMCLPIIWKVFIGILAEQVYGHMKSEKLLPDEQKGCRRQSKGTKGVLMIDKMVKKNCKRIMTNISVAWVDYTKAYDQVPHTWILQCLKIFKIANNTSNVVEKSMKNCRRELTSGAETLGEVKTNTGIFQGENLPLILFAITLIPLSILLRLGESRIHVREVQGMI